MLKNGSRSKILPEVSYYLLTRFSVAAVHQHQPIRAGLPVTNDNGVASF